MICVMIYNICCLMGCVYYVRVLYFMYDVMYIVCSALYVSCFFRLCTSCAMCDMLCVGVVCCCDDVVCSAL